MALRDDIAAMAAAAQQSAVETLRYDLADRHRRTVREYEDAVHAGDPQASAAALEDLLSISQKIAVLEPEEPELTQRESQWLANRPAIVVDPAKLARVKEFAAQSMRAGLKRDSNELFSALDFEFRDAAGHGDGDNATISDLAQSMGLSTEEYMAGRARAIRDGKMRG